MRASVCVMGPLLAKRGKAQVSLPGGCNIGYRPIGLHLQGLEALGADIDLVGGDIYLKAKKLRGAEVFLGGPFGSTVLGTANVMMAACLADGTTVIECAACEPEIVDLADYLNRCGAQITGHGTPRISIEGVDQLRGCEHQVIPDRIEAGTFIIAAAITNGDVKIENSRLDHLMALIDRLRIVGVNVERSADGIVQVSSSRRLEPVTITTQPYPGYPTDLQAQVMALLCLADGNSVITEKIFPDRFVHEGVDAFFANRLVADQRVGNLVLNVARADALHTFARRFAEQFLYRVFGVSGNALAVVELELLQTRKAGLFGFFQTR